MKGDQIAWKKRYNPRLYCRGTCQRATHWMCVKAGTNNKGQHYATLIECRECGRQEIVT